MLRIMGSSEGMEADAQLHAQVKPRLKRRKHHMDHADHPSNAAPILLDIENLRPHFHLPLGQAAKEIGVCKTALKKACRKIGIVGWPFRKLRAVERRITALAVKRHNDTSKAGSRAAKSNDEVVEKLLELKMQLLEGKDCGKGFGTLGIDDEDEGSDLDLSFEVNQVGMDPTVLAHEPTSDRFDDSIQDLHSCHSSSVISQDNGCLFSEKGYCHSVLPSDQSTGDPSSCSICSSVCQTHRPEDHHNEALNDILRSGGNPYASEFLNLADGFSSAGVQPCGGNPSVCMSNTDFSVPNTLQQRNSLVSDFERMQDLPLAPTGQDNLSSPPWTVRDELRSLQSLVRVLLKEQEELTNELQLSQQSLFAETQRTSMLEQTVADLRKQLASHAGHLSVWT